MNKAKIAVLGAGSWGTALANLLSNNALDVTLWGNEPEHINEIKKTGFNQAYLKDIPLSKTLSYATDLQSAVKNSAAVLIGTPSFALRDVLEKAKVDENDISSKISFALGKDVLGRPINTNLAKMPHILIAGATGAGKSVCLNSIIVSLLMFCTPDELKFILHMNSVFTQPLFNDFLSEYHKYLSLF